jgi:hypothetical protein
MYRATIVCDRRNEQRAVAAREHLTLFDYAHDLAERATGPVGHRE